MNSTLQTLYKIARKEKIELAQPFNAVATSWKQASVDVLRQTLSLCSNIVFIEPAYFFYIYHLQEDLESALEAIKTGTPVQKAASEFGIPSGTLYGRCKKVGIELSKNAAVHWSEEAMKKALASYQTGGMSINQAAIHYNLPYSSLYGRINRWKRENGEEALIENRLVLHVPLDLTFLKK